MPINKILDSFDKAVADIFDGAVILVGGFGPADGTPSYLLRALAKQGAKNLTLVLNNAGFGREAERFYSELRRRKIPPSHADAGILVENGQVKKAIASFPVSPTPKFCTPFEIMVEAGEAEVEITSQGTLAERIRAAKAGIPAFYSPVGLGTTMAKGKETRTINGTECILEYAINADYALIRAHKADRWGNLVYRGTSRSFSAVMAGAAKVTITEVGEIVELGELSPEVIITPAVYVDRVVLRPGPAEKKA
ncbi:CoA transferase subunit A [Chloroflexota bacterium]